MSTEGGEKRKAEKTVENQDKSRIKRWPWDKSAPKFGPMTTVGEAGNLQEKEAGHDSLNVFHKADNSDEKLVKQNDNVHVDFVPSQKQNGILHGEHLIDNISATASEDANKQETSLQPHPSFDDSDKKTAEASEQTLNQISFVRGQESSVGNILIDERSIETSKGESLGGEDRISRENTDVTDKHSNIKEKRSAPMNILQTLKKSGTDGPASGRKKQDRDTKTPESGSNNSRINAINNERMDSAGNNKKQEQVVVRETEPKTARKSLALTRTARTSNDAKTTKQINDDNHKTANGGRANPTDLAFATADGNEKDKKTANGDAPRSKPSRTIPGVTGKNNFRILKDQPTTEDPEELKEMAEALLARAVMRRVAAIKEPVLTGPHDKQNAAAEVSGPQMPAAGPGPIKGRSAHKTHSMQSLAVPGSGPGARDDGSGDGADRVSLGSRRDSVRQSIDSVSCKSVDYRLQNSQSVLVGAGNGGSGEEKGKSMLMHDSSLIRAAIPALPLSLALFCLISNVLLPGLGTIISGFFALCCGKSRLSSKGDPVVVTLCINVFVGAAQLGTVTFLLVGWFWSLAWGIKMVLYAVDEVVKEFYQDATVEDLFNCAPAWSETSSFVSSVEYRKEQKQQREKELQTLALSAFGSPGTLRRSLLPPV